MTIRVAIIDDQELIRAGIVTLLENEPDFEVVGQGSDGNEALALCRQTSPDVVLMDVRMRHANGIEATRRLTESSDVETKVLILTTFNLDEYVFDAIRAGASGFLLKDVPAEEFLAAVKVVARGDALLSPSVTRTLIEEFAQTSPAPVMPSLPPEVSELSERELAVLRKLAEGLSNSEIAAALFLGEATVKSHISSILSKLSIRSRAQAIVYAFQNGLVEVTRGE